MEVGTAVVLSGLIISFTTLILKYFPGKTVSKPSEQSTPHDRLLLLEHDHRNLVSVVAELRGSFLTTAKELSDKLQEVKDIVVQLRAENK